MTDKEIMEASRQMSGMHSLAQKIEVDLLISNARRIYALAGPDTGTVSMARDDYRLMADAMERLRERVAELEAENARLLADPMNVGWQRAQDAIKDRAAALSQWKAERIKRERAESERDAIRTINNGWAMDAAKLEEERDALKAALLDSIRYIAMNGNSAEQELCIVLNEAHAAGITEAETDAAIDAARKEKP